MGSRRQDRERRRPAPRLYLVAEPGAPADALAPLLAGALAAGDVAAVLLRLPEQDERSLVKHIKQVAPAVQQHGAALLLDGHADLVARAGADGSHLTGLDALRAALPGLKPERIAGAGGLHTRHDAMLAAEAGADYIMFGEPDPAGRRPAGDAIVARVTWWSELFEIPCVGWAESLEEAAALAAAGADFVALGRFVWTDPEAMIRSATQRLQSMDSVA